MITFHRSMALAQATAPSFVCSCRSRGRRAFSHSIRTNRIFQNALGSSTARRAHRRRTRTLVRVSVARKSKTSRRSKTQQYCHDCPQGHNNKRVSIDQQNLKRGCRCQPRCPQRTILQMEIGIDIQLIQQPCQAQSHQVSRTSVHSGGPNAVGPIMARDVCSDAQGSRGGERPLGTERSSVPRKCWCVRPDKCQTGGKRPRGNVCGGVPQRRGAQLQPGWWQTPTSRRLRWMLVVHRCSVLRHGGAQVQPPSKSGCR